MCRNYILSSIDGRSSTVQHVDLVHVDLHCKARRVYKLYRIYIHVHTCTGTLRKTKSLHVPDYQLQILTGRYVESTLQYMYDVPVGGLLN